MVQILVVDDVPGVRQSIATMLKRAGHETMVASSGEEALSLAEASTPDLVLSDVMMPGIDGVETIERMRKVLPKAKFVAISGGGSLVMADQALKAAADLADATLSKPFGSDELLKTVEAVMEAG